MTINYTTNLSLAEPVTGTESGTWGDDVNKGLTDYLDISIAGTLALTSASFTANALTLANTTGSSSSNGIVATTAQYYVLKISSLAANVTITAPSSSKSYIVVNNDPTYTVTIKASGQTGVTVAVSSRALVVYNGTDYAQVGASAGGSNTQVQYNSSGALAGSANFTFNGTTATINTLNLTNALGVAYGGTGVATTPANGALLIGNGTGYTSATLTAGSNVTITNTSGGITIAASGSTNSYTRTSFTATSGQTTFSATYTVGYVEVYLNGVFLNGADYTATNGTSVVLTVGATTGDIVETIAYAANAIGTINASNITGTVAIANGGTGSTTLASANIPVTNVSNTFTATQIFNGSSSTFAEVLLNAAETTTVSATAATGTINYYVNSQSVLYYTTNASANWTLNVAFSSGTSLNTAMATGQTVTIAFMVTQGSTAYYASAMTIDGTSVTPKWQGGTAPTSGNASGVDIYTYSITKTASATYTVLASQTQFK